MKNLILIASLCFASAVYAGDDKRPLNGNFGETKLSMKLQEVKVNPLEFGSNHFLNNEVNMEELQMKSSETPFMFKKILDEKELRQMVEEVRKQRLDSIVTTQFSTGEKLTRQYFILDEKGYPVKRMNSFWNPKINNWDDPIETYEFILDEDGYVLSQLVYSVPANSGQRYDYVYNDKKQGISLVSSNYVDGEWIPIQKGEYVYADHGDYITQEVISAYNKVSNAWDPVVKAIAGWDEHGRQINFEPYQWNGSEWIANGEKKTTKWDVNNNLIVCDCYIWDTELNGWFNYYRNEQDFKDSDPLQCTRQEKMYYNKTNNSWTGIEEYYGAVLLNKKTIFEYDEQKHIIYEVAYIGETIEEGYVKRADITYEWTTLPEGGSQSIATSMLFPADKEGYVNNWITKRFNARGSQTYSYEKHIANNKLVNYSEQEWTLDENQNVIETKQYKFDRIDDTKRLAVSKQELVYNEANKPVELVTYRGQNTSDDDWVNYTRFEYAYDQDTIRVKERAYRWDGAAYAPNWGNESVYDYTIPVTDLVLWPGGNFYHKLVETRALMPDANGDWDYQASVYHYSDLPTVGIAQNADKNITVYPRCVGDQLNVSADGDVKVNIYNIQGVLMLTTADKNINVSNLSCGIYLVEVNGYKTKIVKK